MDGRRLQGRAGMGWDWIIGKGGRLRTVYGEVKCFFFIDLINRRFTQKRVRKKTKKELVCGLFLHLN